MSRNNHPPRKAGTKQITLIDIGSANIRCLHGYLTKHDEIYVSAFSKVLSRGFRRGEVVDVNSLTNSISAAVEQCEKQLGYVISSAYVSFSHPLSSITLIESQTQVKGDIIKITDLDKNLYPAAQTFHLEDALQDETPLHFCASAFQIDGKPVDNPIGLSGTTLQSRISIIHHLKGAADDVHACLANLNIKIERFIYSPYAEALSVLDDDSLATNTLVVNIGASLTTAILMIQGVPIQTMSLNYGSMNITQHIHNGLGISYADAEKTKIRFFGQWLRKSEAPKVIDQLTDHFTYDQITKTFQAAEKSVETAFRAILREFNRHNLIEKNVQEIVLTGTTAIQLDQLADIAKREICKNKPINVDVKQSHITAKQIPVLEGFERSNFITSLGMLKYALLKSSMDPSFEEILSANDNSNILKKVNKWLRENI